MQLQRAGTVKLAHLFGIRVGVSRSWFVVLFVVIYLLRGYFNAILSSSGEAFAVAVASALLFFASLVLHELGHALVARRLGMQVDGIDLWTPRPLAPSFRWRPPGRSSQG